MTWYVIKRSTGTIVHELRGNEPFLSNSEYPEETFRVTNKPTERQLREWRWRNT